MDLNGSERSIYQIKSWLSLHGMACGSACESFHLLINHPLDTGFSIFIPPNYSPHPLPFTWSSCAYAVIPKTKLSTKIWKRKPWRQKAKLYICCIYGCDICISFLHIIFIFMHNQFTLYASLFCAHFFSFHFNEKIALKHQPDENITTEGIGVLYKQDGIGVKNLPFTLFANIGRFPVKTHAMYVTQTYT